MEMGVAGEKRAESGLFALAGFLRASFGTMHIVVHWRKWPL